MAPGSNIPPVNPTPAKPSQPAGQVVQIVTLPEALKNNSRPMRLEGEVIGQNKDGTTRIKTAEGNIDVTFRGKQPQVGTKLEVEVPAGNPPKNVTVRPAPPTPQPLPTTPPLPQTPTTQPPRPVPAPQTPPTTQQPAPDPSRPQTQPTTQQPLPTTPTTKPAPTQNVPPAPSLPPLTTGDVIELVPLPVTVRPVDKPDPTAIFKPQDKSAAPQAAQTPANVSAKSQTGVFATLLQAAKSVLPTLTQPSNTSLQTQALPQIPAGTPNAFSAVLTNTPATAGIITTQETALPLSAPLIAKIIAINAPTGQTMYIASETTPPPAAGQTIFTTPATNATANTAAPFVSTITATVTILTPQNQPVIQLPMSANGTVQSFVVQAPPATLSVGTQITLLPMATAPTATATTAQIPSVIPAAWRPLLPLMQAASVWPAMDDIFQSFYQATPQAAQILGRVIPSPANGTNFGPAVMLFAAAARAGELQGWIGDRKLEMVHKLGKDALVSRLSAETSTLTSNNDLPATEWKSLPIPLLWQNEISKVLFHVRQEPDEQTKDGKEGGTRFILDMSLPRMGEVQLDGMVNGQRLDVIVRTQMPVSYPMQEAMKTAYAGALEGSDVFGELSFQGDIKQWMHVIKGDENFTASV